MKNFIIIIALLLFFNQLEAQNASCGFKEECHCNTLNETVEHSFGISDFILEGKVLSIETVSIKEIMTTASVLKLKKEETEAFDCAQKALETKQVIRTKLRVNDVFKGKYNKKTVYIITPLDENNCGYTDFEIGENYTVFSTENETADIYFLYSYTLEDHDFLFLKNKYTYWTNKCKRTHRSNEKELEELRKLQLLNN